MVTINLHQPGKINCTIPFPSQWNELFPTEVMEICRQQLKPGNTKDVAKAKILKFIISLRTKLSKKKLPAQWMNVIDAEQAVMHGYPLLDFVYEENNLTQPAEKKIILPGLFSSAVYAPGDGFENLTCGEYEDAIIEYNNFIKEPEGTPLANIAAILWRPMSSLPLFGRGRRRERLPYSQLTTHNSQLITYDSQKRVKHFLALQPHRLYAIFVWFTGCMGQMPLMFPTIYQKNADSSEEADLMAFTKCIHAGAGPKNGTRQQIRMMKLFEFMFDMEQEAIKAEELQKQYDAQK